MAKSQKLSGLLNAYLSHVSKPVLYLLLGQSRPLRQYCLVFWLEIGVLQVFFQPLFEDSSLLFRMFTALSKSPLAL